MRYMCVFVCFLTKDSIVYTVFLLAFTLYILDMCHINRNIHLMLFNSCVLLVHCLHIK